MLLAAFFFFFMLGYQTAYEKAVTYANNIIIENQQRNKWLTEQPLDYNNFNLTLPLGGLDNG